MRTVLLYFVLLAACTDALDQRLALVHEPRVLAVIADPAEVVPGAMVTYHALLAGPEGTIDVAPAWALCRAPKPPTEDNAIANGCLESDVTELGVSVTVTAAVPIDACLLFGPDTTMPGFRPRDPDSTGGYYQPVRVTISESGLELVSTGLTRIKCKLPTAPGPVAQDYTIRYLPNSNPTLLPLMIDGARSPTVTADKTVTLTASWPGYAAESFLYYDPSSQTLVERREAMRVSWFTTGGALSADASAVMENDKATSVSTSWRTPSAGPVSLWLVLRDSRGGIATQSIDLLVQ